MKTFESFESNRWLWRINLALQMLLVVALVLIVNYIGMHTYARFDLTGRRAFSLSPETRGYIEALTKPVTIVVTLSAEEDDEALAQAYRDVRGVLREFEYAARGNTRGGSIRVEYLNVYEHRVRAESLGINDPNVVVFQAGRPGDPRNPPRLVTTEELYRSRNLERAEFEGERTFTAALLDVTSGTRPVLYFLTGHGEMRLDNVDPLRGASQLGAELAARGYETRGLDLTAMRHVPDDASLVVILSPQTPVLRPEREMLRNYLANGTANDEPGRLLACLDPGRQNGLDELLLDWGILQDDVLVLEPDPAFQVTGGDLLIWRFAPHPITQVFNDNRIPVLMGLVRSVRADPGRTLDPALAVTELLATSESSWGEFGYRTPGPQTFDTARDLRGPVRIAALSERTVDPRLGINLRGGRVIAFGNSDYLANHRLGFGGNKTLFLNAVSWSLGRDTRLDIPTRPVRQLQLTLSQEQLVVTRLAILLGPALLVALLGGTMYVARRH